MKTYFITYQWKRVRDAKWEVENVLTKELPIRWLMNRRTKYPNISYYAILFFQELELTEAEYKEYAEKL